jgi:hypothetical protein
VADQRLRTILRHLRQFVARDEGGALTDAQLLERFVAARDEAAFEVLFWRHGELVWNVCRRVLRHEQDAEDAFQATFLALAREAATIGRRASLVGWLYTVAYRAALAARAAAANRARHEGPLGDVPAPGRPAVVGPAAGPVLAAPGQLWGTVHFALRWGLRGLPGGDTLALLLARERNKPHPCEKPRLTEAIILRWARAHRRRTGK